MRFGWPAVVVGLLAVTAIVDVSCAPAQSPTTLNTQAIARGTVETLETVWNDVANACVQVAAAADDKAVLQTCIDALDPARQAIIAGGAAVDTWTDADQKNFPCVISDAMAGLNTILPLLKVAGVTLPQVVTDGQNLANLYTPQCVRPVDAGTKG